MTDRQTHRLTFGLLGLEVKINFTFSDKSIFQKHMFDLCHRPEPGTEMTFAYFHLKPYVFVDNNGSVTSGIEANMAKEFANKYKLKMKWFNANYVWGAFDKNLQRLFLFF